MHCIERPHATRRLVAFPALRHGAALGLVLLAACGTPPTPPLPPTAKAPVESRRLPPTLEETEPEPALRAPAAPRSHAQLKLQAARRIVAANPEHTYEGTVPNPLLAIPVLEIELNADGSVRDIEVMRLPRQARDTVQMAIEAVRRAAPFGDVSGLPRPWKFTETFLFNDDRKFKPRSLE